MKKSFYNLKQKNILVLIIMLFSAFSINAQNSWLGTVNNDWRTTGNWSDNLVPDKNTDVIIESSCTYYPDINNTGDTCKTILIKTGGTLDIINGGNLTVTGNLTVDGHINGNVGTLNILGNLILNDGASITINDCNISCADAQLDINSTITYSGSNEELNNWNYGNLILNGTGTMQITGDDIIPTRCVNLTINNTGNILKIPENKALTVTGTLTNNVGLSGIVIESGPLGDGSLISSTPNINATVKRYITGNRWHYISSPIDAAPVTLFNTNNFMWWDASEEWTGTGDYSPWKGYADTNLQNATGYAYYYYEDTLEYKGNMNVSNYTVTLHKSATGSSDLQGWNLVGNPYTSVLDWDALVSDGAVPSGTENAIYFFDDDGSGTQSNYRYYVPSTGGTYGVGTEDATGKIPLGQAFFIKTNTDNDTLTFNSNCRVHNSQGFYKNKTGETLRLNISDNNLSDETVFRIIENANISFDTQYDASKLFPPNEEIPQIYSYISETNEKIAINSIPDLKNNSVLFIGIKANAGTYTISSEETSLSADEIYLFDNELKTYTDLRQSNSYSFYYSGGEANNRFSIVFTKTASVIDKLNSQNISIFPNPVKNMLTVNNCNSDFENKFIEILSVTGKICYKSDLNSEKKVINLDNYSDGIYFLKVTDKNNNTEIHKFIIHK